MTRQPQHVLYRFVCLDVVNKIAQYYQSCRDAECKIKGNIHRFWGVETGLRGRHDTKKYGSLAIHARLIILHFKLDDDLFSNLTIVKHCWKAALKIFRAARAQAFDHRVVHLNTTLIQYENMKSTSETKEKIGRIKHLLNI